MSFRDLASLFVLSLLLSTPLRAANITDVIDAADGDDPFDANIEMAYDFQFRDAKISRESSQNGENVLVREFDFQQMTHTMTPRLQVGLWHDLAISVDLPLVIYDKRSGKFQTGVRGDNPSQGKGYSTMSADRCRFSSTRPGFCDSSMPSSRSTLSGSPNGYPVMTHDKPEDNTNHYQSDTVWDMFDSNPKTGEFSSVRGGFNNLIGFGDMSLGLAWAPLNQERFHSQPSWVLRFRYTIPTGKVMNPLETANNANPGGVGMGLHQFTWSTAFSHRFEVLEPYSNVFFTFGVPGASAVNGMLNEWSTANLYQGGITSGLEIIPYENKTLSQRFAIDLHGTGIYHGQQRTYSELSDMLNEVSLRDQYATLLGHVGLYFSAAEFVRFDLGVDIGTDTNHFITGERIGTDKNGNGVLELDKDADGRIDRDAKEGNVYFNPVIDTPGRRLRVEETLLVYAGGRLALTF